MYEVAAIPGRIRLKHKNIYGDKSLAKYINVYIENLNGVKYSKVNPYTSSILIVYDEQKVTSRTLKKNIENAIKKIIKNGRDELENYDNYCNAVENKNKEKKKVLTYGGLYLLFKFKQGFYGKFSISRNVNVLKVASIVTIVGGYPLIKGIYKKFTKNVPTDSDILLRLTALSFTIMRESSKGVFVLFLKSVSNYIKYSAEVDCLKQLNQSMDSNHGMVSVISTDNKEILVPASSLEVGNIINVNKGEVVQCEGVVVEGSATANSLYYNGQPNLTVINENSIVHDGFAIMSGNVKVKVTEKPKESNKRSDVLENISLNKKVEFHGKYGAKIALTAAGINFVLTRDILNAISVLLVLCPSASKTAFNSGMKNYISNLSNKNIYYRNPSTLDDLMKLDTAAFDKTGTLTHGIMKIHDIELLNNNYSEEEIVNLCAACEVNSYHPVALTLQNAASKKFEDKKLEYSVSVPSKGVKCKYDNHDILIGNIDFMLENHINVTNCKDKYQNYEKEAYTPVLVSMDGTVSCIFVLEDRLRKHSKKLMNKLKKNSIEDIYIITGDNYYSAGKVANNLNIDKVYSECSIEDKETVIRQLKRRGKVMMVGDGINDTVAMKTAHLSASFADSCCDKTKLNSDCVIFDDDISKLGDFIYISRKSYRQINQAIWFSRLYNYTLGVFAFMGYFNPFTAKSLNTLNSLIILIINQRVKYVNPKKERVYKNIVISRPQLNNLQLSEPQYSLFS